MTRTKKKAANARAGLLAGGNWIIDQVKMIDVYPQREQLANISGQSQGTGGSPYNVLIDLARMGARFPLFGAGLVGDDALGKEILEDCRRHKIDTTYLDVTNKAPTSYTDVMTEKGCGHRTFFHARGANALWRGDDLDFRKVRARIFHLGYLLLLDALDERDAKFGTKAARMLAAAQNAGLKTSVDVVSEDSDRFAKIVGPALKHVDYCILNEIEAGKTTGFKIRQSDGQLDTVSLRHAVGALLQQGVREVVVIHFPEGGFARAPRNGNDRMADFRSNFRANTSRVLRARAMRSAPACCWACTKTGIWSNACKPAFARRQLHCPTPLAPQACGPWARRWR